MTKKQLILFLLIDVLITVGIVVFIAQRSRPHTPSKNVSPTATTTTAASDGEIFAQWHTYTNAGLGFMFEYPAAYDTDTQFKNCAINSTDGAITIGSRSYIQVDADNKQTLKQFIKKTLDEHAEEEWTIEKQTQTTVGDESAVTVEYRFGIVNRFGSITFVHHNNYFYTISFQAGAFACGNEPAVYEHILKTFKWVQYKED